MHSLTLTVKRGGRHVPGMPGDATRPASGDSPEPGDGARECGTALLQTPQSLAWINRP